MVAFWSLWCQKPRAWPRLWVIISWKSVSPRHWEPLFTTTKPLSTGRQASPSWVCVVVVL